MSRILLDQNVPRGLRNLLTGHDVSTAYQMGWAGLSNGDLLIAAEESGFEAMVTCDQNIRYQQTIARRKIALVVLSTNNWTVLRVSPEPVVEAIARVTEGSVHFVQLPG